MNTSVNRVQLTGARNDDARPQVLTWDGRLDNRAELFVQLAGHLEGETSNEAIVRAAYDRWGIEGFTRLIGDWSVALRDVTTDSIVLASDYMGVRPLYYHREQSGAVVWSTHLRSIIEATRISDIDERFIAGFLLLGGFPNRTPYTGIYSVPPGCAVCLTERDTTVRAFWKPPVGGPIRFQQESQYDEELRWLFAEAVSVRLQSNSPVLAELSGGLDSSSVVCMASQLIRTGQVQERPFTTISYDTAGSLDAPFIRDLEAFCGVHGVHVSTDDQAVASALEVGDVSPECWAPFKAIIARLARQLGVKVLLTGMIGDQTMGNRRDDSLQVAGRIRGLEFSQAVRDAMAWSKSLRIPMARILWKALQASLPSAMASRRVYMSDASSPYAVSGDSLVPQFAANAALSNAFSSDWIHAPAERRAHLWSLTLVRELRTLQVPDAFRDLDYTHPFTHRPLVEFMMSIPADVVCSPGQPRRLMRRAFADLWPEKLRARRSKSYFTAAWINAMRPMAASLMKAPSWHVVERGWVDRASVTHRLSRLLHGLPCGEPQLRQILVLEHWLRQREAGVTNESIRQIA